MTSTVLFSIFFCWVFGFIVILYTILEDISIGAWKHENKSRITYFYISPLALCWPIVIFIGIIIDGFSGEGK